MTSSPPADVLVLCALFEEYEALLQVSDGIAEPGWVRGTSRGGWMSANATFRNGKGEEIRIVATFASGMGREIALATVLDLLRDHSARALAMCGICAGRRGKVSLGDVIFADRLYSYDAGKTTVVDGVAKFEGDPLQFNPGPHWVQRMHAISNAAPARCVDSRPGPTYERQEDWVLQKLLDGDSPLLAADFNEACPDWADVLRRLYRRNWLAPELTLTAEGRKQAQEQRLYHPAGLPPAPPFKVHVAPIATGAAVVEDATLFERLSQSMRKVLGIDMEGSALGVAGAFHQLPVVVVKAVSDFGDPFKDDRYRTFAARASAEYLVRLLMVSVDLLASVAVSTPHTDAAPTADLPIDLIDALAELHPDVGQARAVWERAGGKGSEVENVSQPRDLWQRLWMRSALGAAVRPGALLRVVAAEAPNNVVIQKYLATWANK